MGRSVAGVVIGVLVGARTMYFLENVGHALFPSPAALDFSSPEALRASVARVPFGAKAFVVLGWFAGAWLGGLAALAVGRRWAPTAWVVAGVTFAMSALSLVSIPHPWWMAFGAIAAAAGGGFLAVRVGRGGYGAPPMRRGSGLFE